MAGKVGAKKKATKASIAEFHDSLVLARWARGFFQGEAFGELRARLNRDGLEGLDAETGHTRFYMELMNGLFNLNKVAAADFSRYDFNIVGHWEAICARRVARDGEEIRLKYYQYLSLLVTELYLDWYFNRREELKAGLEGEIAAWNQEHDGKARLAGGVTDEGLRKVAFWEATGSGKTLLMHVNIRQYLAYAKAAGQAVKGTIVLTPNEGLSRQHVKELKASGFSCEMLSDDMSAGFQVGVVDSGKLISERSQRKKGEKSMLAAAFEGENLVLVDEGHHGASAADGEHRLVRDQLCRDGFSFEYSATFGQAVAGTAEDKRVLRDLYAKNILFDYSYKYFHEDGYGKEAFILNLPSDEDEGQVFDYLCANMLAFYQQRMLFEAHGEVMKEYNIENPLCVFVGHTVKGAKDETEMSDVARIVEFFAAVLDGGRRKEVEGLFDGFIKGEGVLFAPKAHNPLEKRYVALLGKSGKEIYADLLRLVFHASEAGRLYVTHEKGTGEITLSVGATGAVFGLISIGDAAMFMKKLSDLNLPNVELRANEISGVPRFDTIDERTSPITMLVGSRKFTEGWSSWRVSAMGLLNMGQNEGTQIIQFFGRGVRLKGRNFSLKRTKAAERVGRVAAAHLEYLETLHIFGIRANYMAKFREYMEAEGVRTADSVLMLEFPILSRFREARKKLLVPRVKEGFRLNQKGGFKSKAVTLFEIPEELLGKTKAIHVTYDDHARIEFLDTKKLGKGVEAGGERVEDVKLEARVLELIDWDKVYRELMREKARGGYWNLALEKERLRAFGMERDDWYTLFARREDLEFTSFANVAHTERLFMILVKEYMRKFYEVLQGVFEEAHSEMAPLPEEWLPEAYTVEIENTEEGLEWKTRLEELVKFVEKEKDRLTTEALGKFRHKGFVLIAFSRHLYSPLVRVEDNLPFTFKPTSLDSPSEWKFVQDLEAYYNAKPAAFCGVDLYLMRNAAHRMKGVGFAEAGNFYPDFLLWIVERGSGKQHLTFVDPKGMRNVGFEDPKVNFCKEVKVVEARLNEERAAGQSEIVLESAILSDTPYSEIGSLFGQTKEAWEDKHVFFMEDKAYLEKLLDLAWARVAR